MATKAVAVVDEAEDAEIVEADQLNKKEATALNRKIKAQSEKVAQGAYDLLDLLEQASVGNIHKALGYKSWTEWYSENVQIQVTDAAERKALANMMSGKGMSQRAIAASLGVGQATVSRDLDGSGDSDESPATTTGLDGKEYTKKQKPEADEDDDEDEPEVIEGEVVEDPAEIIASKPLPNQVMVAVQQVRAAADNLFDVSEDPRFAKGRKKFREQYENDLVDTFNALADVLDKLEIEISEAEDDEDTEPEETDDEAAEEDSDAEDEADEDADEDAEDDDDF